jgi:hypothetical protein
MGGMYHDERRHLLLNAVYCLFVDHMKHACGPLRLAERMYCVCLGLLCASCTVVAIPVNTPSRMPFLLAYVQLNSRHAVHRKHQRERDERMAGQIVKRFFGSDHHEFPKSHQENSKFIAIEPQLSI